MVKAPIKVIIRSRPTVNYATKNIEIDENTAKVSINIPKQADSGYRFNLDASITNKKTGGSSSTE
jgi:hypothetical protein